MTCSLPQYVGVDISKDTLEVYLHPAGLSRRFANDAQGCSDLVRWLKGFKVACVAFEPTGAYHHHFERRLCEAGQPLAKVNPRRARRFAEAIGQPAKTDPVDAAMLARFAALIQPPVRAVLSDRLDEMKELHLARRALVKDRTAAANRGHIRRSALLKRQILQRLAQIDRQIAAIDAALRRLLADDAGLKARFDILASIPGVGETTALALLLEMPELGSLEPRAAASLAGLAPIARDSGKHAGRRSIKGGRASLRQAIYMPALAAVRCNPDLRAKYQALRNAGKPAKLALTAVMRKLVILANALIRDQRTWTPRAA
jgi:transposase